MYQFPNGFLWGGATDANQFEGGVHEGGKGLSVPDVMTGGTKTTPRHVTDGILPEYHYPSHEAVDFFSFSYYSSSTATDDPTVPVANGNMMRERSARSNPWYHRCQNIFDTYLIN